MARSASATSRISCCPHVAQRDLPALWRALDALGLATPNVGLVSDIIACPGLDYCSLANTRSIPVAQEIARRFRNLDVARDLGRLHINISGCINACGHHHVGHIGILGVEKNDEEFYQITIGGRADEDARLGTLIGPAVRYAEVADVVEDIVAAYLELRERPDETFLETVQAHRHRAVQGARLCRSLRAAASSPIRYRARRSTMRRSRMTLPVIVPAARFLADAAELAQRAAPTGVLWPNDRRVAELAPWLDRLALVALAFPTFRDGRAYSQARLLRERYGFRGELRATGDVLRDQFLFLHARRLRLLRGQEGRRRRGLRRGRRRATACSISRARTDAPRRRGNACCRGRSGTRRRRRRQRVPPRRSQTATDAIALN